MDKISGFTIIELLVTLFIFSIVMIIVYSSFMTHNRISNAQKELLLLDQNIRAVSSIIADYIRMAGFGTKYSLSYESGNSVNGFTQVFTAIDNDNNGSDRLTVVFANRLVGTVTTNLDNATSYSGNRIFIISDKINLLDDNRKKYVFFERCPFNKFFELISEPQSLGRNKYLLQLRANDYVDAYEGDNVYAVRAITIYYDSSKEEIKISENTGAPSQTLATDVESIQFQYGIDENGDGVYDDTDRDGNPFDNTVPKDKEKFLKIVKLTILMKTVHPDPSYRDTRTTYNIANYTINLDTNDSNGINSKYDWHFRRKMIEIYITPRNYE